MKKNGIFARVCMFLALIFMYAPILVLIVFSFNDSKSRTVWTGFSLHWYEDLFSDTRILQSLATTIEVSVLAMIIATLLGTAAAIGFRNMRRRSRTICLSINNIPMSNADIITGVSLMMLFVFAFGAFNATLGKFFGITLKMGFGTLLLAHITFDVPYVILSVLPRLNQLDPNLYVAAPCVLLSTCKSWARAKSPLTAMYCRATAAPVPPPSPAVLSRWHWQSKN